MKSNLLLVSVGLAAGFVASANAGIIQDQLPTGNGLTSQNFTDFGAYSSAGFDDFTLNSAYDLTSLVVYGSNSAGANPGLNVSVDLWISNSPAYQTGFYVAGVEVGGNLHFNLTGITLGAGTWWISAQVSRPFGGGGGQWYWSTSNSTNGSVGLWQNPGGAFGQGAGLQPNGVINGGQSVDWAWTLEGEKVPAPGAIALLGLAGLRGRRRR